MDWMRVGWGWDLSPEFDATKNFHVDLRNAIFSGRFPLDIAIDSIHKIVKEYPGPFTLMVSGGVDSQSMLWAWHKSKVPFRAVSIEYVNERGKVFNRHDLRTLKRFAKIHNIEIEYLQFNVFNFLENDLQEYAVKYQCTSPQICTYMKMSELIQEGTVIFSGNYLSESGIPFDYTIHGLKRYADISQRSLIPFFFLHDAELAPSFISTINKIKSKSIVLDNYKVYLDKCAIFTQCGFPVISQPQKFSGFEKIKDYYDREIDRITFSEKLRYSNKPSKRAFDILFRYRLTQHIDYIDPVIMSNLKGQST